MDWQLIFVGGVVGAAAVYIARRWYRTWIGSDKHGACAGCDCAHETPARGSRPID